MGTGIRYLHRCRKEPLSPLSSLLAPPKHIPLQKGAVSWKPAGTSSLKISATSLALGVEISSEDRSIRAEDNYLDLAPGEELTVKLRSLAGEISNKQWKSITLRSLVDTYLP